MKFIGERIMATKKCPDCGCQSFYVKDPEDHFNIFEFNLENGEIVPQDTNDSDSIEVAEETETYCDRCAWHDKFKALK
jgi:hypothetical protein